MSRFVPVPYDALDLVTPAEYGAVLDLYKRAHSLQWKPFKSTSRALATRWGISSRAVWRLLETLAAGGHLTLEKGVNAYPSTITVGCPTMERQESSNLNQKVGQKVVQDDDASSPTIDESESEGESEGGEHLTRPETKTRDQDLSQRIEQDPEPDLPTAAPAPASPVAVRVDEPPRPSALSARARAALHAVGLSTLGQLSAMTASELLRRPGIGPSTVAEVVAMLAVDGKTLRPEPLKASRSTGCAERAKPYRDAWDSAWKASQEGAYPWVYHRDNARLEQLGASLGTQQEAESAFAAFFDAHKRGPVFPEQDPPTIAKFSIKAAEWVLAGRASGPRQPMKRHALRPLPEPRTRKDAAAS